ncbi:DDE-type integrase/transposase/recombinase [Pseudoflavonifractor sp. BIOML-A6]|nr:DDE-type integrase/transposase/recombinase [Pseudoflavonifractor sp. BIOML-A16]MTR05071.1 DDE-type integrase/transposase/recombinase [Pseudoflavonifractor sp. BIOML-A15]MTR12584.1 DDE-type integrase/transposase/recombinase [Pseudoflavonifractor sp. BIOML-A17]MTR20468.1 DDE-type integrase/transposase/recombinase [Pseudoflavonifractor sp. BIOML-A19]MTR32692.1 DDE-type integrase/transposase/recombinase [Pseudoflavonifractor sp. BIOML-A14]MTR44114.1 DDE-type integrase/transposase/recombinase [P
MEVTIWQQPPIKERSASPCLKRATKWFRRRGITVECVQIDNGFEFTNRYFNFKRDLTTLFEATTQRLGIRHKLIRPYTPRHNEPLSRSEASPCLTPFLFSQEFCCPARRPQRPLQQQNYEAPLLAFSHTVPDGPSMSNMFDNPTISKYT